MKIKVLKNRYILLLLFSIAAFYIACCNISFIYTNKNSTIPLVASVNYTKDSFDVTNSTVFWQGFYHDWTYNHRVNRLGDWVQSVRADEDGIRAILSHSGAAGSGADVLSYQSFFTYLKTQKAQFFSSIVAATVRGREATTTTKIITVKAALPKALKNYSKGCVILNGFDLACSTTNNGKVMGSGTADKLSNLYVEVDHLKMEQDSFSFDLKIKLGADCDSPECVNFTPGDNEWFDYQLRVAYQIIMYDNDVHITSTELDQFYKWRKPFKTRPDIDPNEIFRQDKILKNKNIKGIAGYSVGIPLINKIDISLPKGKGGIIRKRMETPHLLSLDIAIADYTYNAASGICNLNADLFFKNWRPNMRVLSFGNDGMANINAGIKLLQINDASAVVSTQSLQGKINWETTQLEQREADDPNAVKSFVFNK